MKNLKPFDLQAALSGKAVMLRNGRKAYIRHHETELDVSEHYKLAGYLSLGDVLSWCEDGSYSAPSRTSCLDIIGMYPETRVINGFEVPAPESKEPEHYGARYYLAAPTGSRFHSCESWVGDTLDKIWLERGLVFLTAEDAIATAKAMLGIDPYSETES